MAEIKPVAEFTADDMQQQWDEARRREREAWEHRVRNLHAEVAAWQERYMQIVKLVADGVALSPAVPPIIDSTALETARAEERERCAKVCDATPPYPFRPSIEAAHAIRALK